MKHRFAWAVAALGLTLAPALDARKVNPGSAADPRIEFERYTLDNGIEVILHQDNTIPLVAVDVWYHVGAGDEAQGKSGFAHLFEHMLFQGAKHIGEDVHFDILKNIGSSAVNGSTNYDRTNYFEVVPSNQLETALWLESDRMGYLLPMLNQKSLDNQIDVVRNERRLRVDNQPYGPTEMRLAELLYPEGHPYRYAVIGKHEDLESATLTDVRNFYKTWYVPANATITLAGDFELDQAKQLIDKWFGSFPATTRPTHTPPPAPSLDASVRETLQDDFAKLRLLQYAWHAPALFADGDAELDILADALGADGTGRLYTRLVHDEQLATDVWARQESAEQASMFRVGVVLATGADLDRVEAILREELQKVQQAPLEQDEVARAVVGIESRFVWRLESLLARAETLQRYNHYVGKPDWISQDLARYRQSSPAKVLATAKAVLGKPRVEIVTVPAEQGGN